MLKLVNLRIQVYLGANVDSYIKVQGGLKYLLLDYLYSGKTRLGHKSLASVRNKIEYYQINNYFRHLLVLTRFLSSMGILQNKDLETI